jgi:DNA-directed RNA polymerase subunit RPC12/RpoP
MAIQYRCTHCSTAMEAPDFLADELQRCPTCGESVVIPPASDNRIQASLPPDSLYPMLCPVCYHDVAADLERCANCGAALSSCNRTERRLGIRRHMSDLDVRRDPYQDNSDGGMKNKLAWLGTAFGVVVFLVASYFVRGMLAPGDTRPEKIRVEETVCDGLKSKLGRVPEQLALHPQGDGKYKGTAVVDGKTLDITATITNSNLWFEYQERVTLAHVEQFVAETIKKQSGQAAEKLSLTDQGGGKYKGTAKLGPDTLDVSATVDGANIICEWQAGSTH